MTLSVHPLAPHTLPVFIPYPNGPDYLMIGMAVFLVVATFGVGLLYWRLHALPEHIAHKSQKVQFQIVCVLALLAMFTHMHIFWIAGLLLALIDLPDFGTLLRRISAALDRIASVNGRRQATSGWHGRMTSARRPLTPSVDEARAEAIVVSGQMLKDLGGKFWNNGQWQVRVEDEAGEKVCALTFSAGRS